MSLMSKAILTQSINAFGRETQMVVATEEMSELQKEICKVLRGLGSEDHIAEEIADVEIVVEQLKIMFNNFEQVARWKRRKLDRLMSRTEAEMTRQMIEREEAQNDEE